MLDFLLVYPQPVVHLKLLMDSHFGTYYGADLGPPEGSTEGTIFFILEFDSTCQVLQ